MRQLVDVAPALALTAALAPSVADLRQLVLRLDAENLQARLLLRMHGWQPGIGFMNRVTAPLHCGRAAAAAACGRGEPTSTPALAQACGWISPKIALKHSI